MKVKTRTNEYTNTAYYRDFEIVDKLPKVGDCDDYIFSRGYKTKIESVEKVEIDCEQGNSDVWNYDFYKITDVESYYDGEVFLESQHEYRYYAVKKQNIE